MSSRIRTIWRWLGWICLALIVILILTRVWLGLHADRRLQALQDGARARGEPVAIEDLDKPPIPDDRNAAILIRQGAQQLNITKAQRDREQEIGYESPGWSTSRLELFERELLPANQPSLELLRGARAHPAAHWNLRIRTITDSMTDLTSIRELAQLAAAAAVVEARRGNTDAAFDYLLDLLACARALDQCELLVPHLVAVGIDSMARDAVFEMSRLPLRVTGDSNERYAAVMAALLDDKPRDDGLRRAMIAERVIAVHEISKVANLGGRITIVRPALVYDAGYAHRRIDAIAATTTEPNWPSAKARMPAEPNYAGRFGSIRRAGRLMSSMFTPSLDRAVQTEFRARTDRRAAAIALAISRYRTDHNGEFPGSLNDLVPGYLRAVPADPMSADNRPFIYATRDGRRILYSHGANGNDDGGNDKIPPRSSQDEWAAPDRVYPLVPPVPPATTSLQAPKEG